MSGPRAASTSCLAVGNSAAIDDKPARDIFKDAPAIVSDGRPYHSGRLASKHTQPPPRGMMLVNRIQKGDERVPR